ncbi:MAG: lipid-A-disaccharide synthase [Terracidiphilus sp.]|nr:lipid-A-disaccharide synthase [Terracidiphilus sp.]
MSSTIFISAGEASGEHYGALLIDELIRQSKAQEHEVPPRFIGMGGERMETAGLERIVKAEDVAVMGLTEVVRHLPRIWREFQKLKAAIRREHPAVAILIDFPEIHLRLARLFHSLGIPVVYFVPPQIWAWKQHRVRLIQRYVTRLAVIFPFEEAFYRSHGVAAEFVGHPLAELPLPTATREEFAAANGLASACTWVGLLPGSRPHEIRDHLPELLRTASLLTHQQPDTHFEFLVPLAPTLNEPQRQQVRAYIQEHSQEHDLALPIHLVADARATLHHARVSAVASGTATVEAALIGNPFVVVYRVSPLTYAIAKRVVKVTRVAMANLIAGRDIVPELLQNDFRAEKIVQHLRVLLPDGPARQSMMQDLKSVREALRPDAENCNAAGSGAVQRVAAIVLEELSGAARASTPTAS